MDPLSFLNVDDPRMRQATFSGLAGQKAGLMEKYTKPKQSVGAAAVEGGIGGAIAGVNLAANLGAFDTVKKDPNAAGTSDYGNRTAPTVDNEPYQGGAVAEVNKAPFSVADELPSPPKSRLTAGGMSSEEYNQKWGNKSGSSFLAQILG